VNIFAVDNDPRQAAIDLSDKHVVKMILETAQILCTVAQQKGHQAPYRSTHKHHPVVKWTSMFADNWAWLVRHGFGLCWEYTERYKKIHTCQKIIQDMADRTTEIWPGFYYQDAAWEHHTPFVQCMPDIYKCDDPILAYRKYYVGEKSQFAKWKNTQPPKWYVEMLNEIQSKIKG